MDIETFREESVCPPAGKALNSYIIQIFLLLEVFCCQRTHINLKHGFSKCIGTAYMFSYKSCMG